MTPSDSPTNQFRAFAGLVGELSRTPGIHETGSESGQLGSGRCRARVLAVTTTEGAADFVAPSDRIAPFDQDAPHGYRIRSTARRCSRDMGAEAADVLGKGGGGRTSARSRSNRDPSRRELVLNGIVALPAFWSFLS
jgi:hypothetical protein